MEARIYRPAKTATQSGRANTRKWRLEFEPESAVRIDSLMGWTGSDDVRRQVRMEFLSREAAESFCRKHGIPYHVAEPHEGRARPRPYADNYRFDKVT